MNKELPPYQDLKVEIRKEHLAAELLRLRAGYGGCGCELCQELYRTLDMGVYGSRVSKSSDMLQVLDGKPGADLWNEYNQSESWSKGGQLYYLGGMAYGFLENGSSICIGREKVVNAVIADTDLSYNIPAFDWIIAMEREATGIKKESKNDARIRTRSNSSTTNKRSTSGQSARRGRPVLYTRHRAAGTGRPAGKGLARRLPKPKQPRLFT